jgi:hypothetical protein
MAKETPRAKTLKALQKLVRLEAADDNGYCACVTCGAIARWSEMDGGHFLPKGSSSRWALEKENVHPQCKGCNGFGMRFGSASQQYTTWMIDYYGRDFVDHMLATKNEVWKLYKKDYEAMLKDFTEQIKFHLNRVRQ